MPSLFTDSESRPQPMKIGVRGAVTRSKGLNIRHRFYEDLGYTNIKTQYSFVKPLDPAAAARVRMFVPRVDPAS